MQSKVAEKYFFLALLIATFVFAFLIFRPFWIVIILGISFSIVLHPIYAWLKERKLPNWLASLLTVIFFTIVVCGPLLGIGALVFQQSENVYSSVVKNGSVAPFLSSVNVSINKFLPEGVDFNINDKVSSFVSYISNNVAKIFGTAVSAFFSFILVLFIIFYFFCNKL